MSSISSNGFVSNASSSWSKASAWSAPGSNVPPPNLAAQDGTQQKTGVTDKFNAVIMDRIQDAQKRGRVQNKSPEDAQALADSISRAMGEIKDTYGQAAANQVMSQVLQEIDVKGFNLESFTSSFSEALRDAAQAGLPHQLKKLSDSFNQGLNAGSADGDEEPDRSRINLSQAIGQFWGLKDEGQDLKPTAMGFSLSGGWGKVNVEEQSGPLFIQGTPEAAELALESTASCSINDLGSDSISGLVNFLRDTLGNEEAANYLENAPQQADLMGTIDAVIGLVMRDPKGGQDQAAQLEDYLNGSIKNAVNASAKMNVNLFGYVEFSGWDFSQAQGRQSAPTPAATSSPSASEAPKEFETGVTAKWGYTSRDDATFIYSGRNKIKLKETAQDNQTIGQGLGGGSFWKNILGKTGNLIDAKV